MNVVPMNDYLFAIDPSSTRTGWAVLLPGEVYVNSGAIRPSAKLPPYSRIGETCDVLLELLGHFDPAVVVIEWTSGKRHDRAPKNISGLGIYGVAVGALWREAVRACPEATIEGVLENVWTGGIPKSHRKQIAAAMFPAYDPSNDLGSDESDALMLGVWWQRESQIRKANS